MLTDLIISQNGGSNPISGFTRPGVACLSPFPDGLNCAVGLVNSVNNTTVAEGVCDCGLGLGLAPFNFITTP